MTYFILIVGKGRRPRICQKFAKNHRAIEYAALRARCTSYIILALQGVRTITFIIYVFLAGSKAWRINETEGGPGSSTRRIEIKKCDGSGRF
jgi:hypothetical protein